MKLGQSSMRDGAQLDGALTIIGASHGHITASMSKVSHNYLIQKEKLVSTHEVFLFSAFFHHAHCPGTESTSAGNRNPNSPES
jgi:hypothetical protein